MSELDPFLPSGRDNTGHSSILAEYLRQGYPTSMLGRVSRPVVVDVDANTVARVASLSRLPVVPAVGEAVPLAYLWFLIYSTPTNRAFQDYIAFGLPVGVAHVHAEDTYRVPAALRIGDRVEVTCRIDGSFERSGRGGRRLVFIDYTWHLAEVTGARHCSLSSRTVTVHELGVGAEKSPERSAPAQPGGDAVVGTASDTAIGLGELKPGATAGTLVDLGPVSPHDVVLWMGATDCPSRHYYDPGYARERLPDGRNVVPAGHLANLGDAVARAWFGGAEVRLDELHHVQQRSFFVGERVYAAIGPVEDEGLKIEFLDEGGAVRNVAVSKRS